MDQADIPCAPLPPYSCLGRGRRPQMAVFKLQSSINDPAFADVFISSGGRVILRRPIMTTGGQHPRLLPPGSLPPVGGRHGLGYIRGCRGGGAGGEGCGVGGDEPVGEYPARGDEYTGGEWWGINLDRGQKGLCRGRLFGFRALKPAVAVYPQFFELVIQQLQSADHALCANALGLINALVRDAVVNDVASGTVAAGGQKGNGGGRRGRGEDWSFAEEVEEVRVDLERPEHRRALKGLHLASAPDRRHVNGVGGVWWCRFRRSRGGTAGQSGTVTTTTTTRKTSRKHNPEKWERLGFETESPAAEFETAGVLGNGFDGLREEERGWVSKLLLEQSTHPLNERCPVARASLAVTMILYDHFEVDKV
ncbi:hypothetical protein QC762_0029320 [Podospora pseudocomata]|uniref:ELMO domain-containing protein n=1 Tax=Podospora pseudocomata TaxID=2093779 RepID=A0ABR0GSC2_9PEZI|nr:hypothetical protein QC762_0029320 [Podospora pseudocomata]